MSSDVLRIYDRRFRQVDGVWHEIEYRRALRKTEWFMGRRGERAMPMLEWYTAEHSLTPVTDEATLGAISREAVNAGTENRRNKSS